MRSYIQRLFLGILLIPAVITAAQISGFVFDKSTNKPMAMVNISVASYQIGTVTDVNGYFVLSGPIQNRDTVTISHIGYEILEMTVTELQKNPKIYLHPLSIIMDGVEVAGIYQKYQMDTPLDVEIIDREIIIERAPSNLGELLRMEAAVQIQSVSPGYQSVSIRGSNPEQVLVLYDGIPIRSAADDIADISWIDVNDVSEVQVLKTGQSVMFGEGAIGGVLNLRSDFDSSYRFRFTGRIGNYDTRDAYFSFSKAWKNWENQYSLSIRTANYIDKKMIDDISTASAFHNFHSSYRFSNSGKLTLRGMVMDRFLSVIHRLDETDDERRIASILYEGSIFGAENLLLQVLYRQYGTTYMMYIPTTAFKPQARFEKTKINDEIKGFKIEQNLKRGNLNISYSAQYYQSLFESDLLLDFIMSTGYDSLRDERSLQRESVGLYNVFKYQTDTGSELFPVLDWNWSFRYDYAFTERYFENPLYYYIDEKYDTDIYRALNFKIGLETRGESPEGSYRIFMHNGANVRFPSLYDIYLNDVSRLIAFQDSSISPERVISSELGSYWTRQFDRYGVFLNEMELKISVFRNSYFSKIYYSPVIGALPVTKNWNDAADISGLDLNFRLNVFAERFILELGGLWLNMSNTWLFPNKPSVKYQADLAYRYGKLSCRVRGFYEGRQTGLARLPGGQTFFEDLNERADMNIYVNYRFIFSKFDVLCGLVVTNIFSNENSGLVYSYLNRIQTLQFNMTLGIK